MKWIGIFVLIISFFSLVKDWLAGIQGQQRETQSALDLFTLLSNEISQFQTPLPEIYEKAKRMGLYDQSFWEKVEESDLQSVLQERMTESNLAPNIRQIVEDFCKTLGRLDVVAQSRACELAQKKLEQELQALRTQVPKRKKLCIAVSVCVGGSFLILLI